MSSFRSPKIIVDVIVADTANASVNCEEFFILQESVREDFRNTWLDLISDMRESSDPHKVAEDVIGAPINKITADETREHIEENWLDEFFNVDHYLNEEGLTPAELLEARRLLKSFSRVTRAEIRTITNPKIKRSLIDHMVEDSMERLGITEELNKKRAAIMRMAITEAAIEQILKEDS